MEEEKGAPISGVSGEVNPERKGTIKEVTREELEAEESGMKQFLRGIKRRIMSVRRATGKSPKVLTKDIDRIIEETKDK